MHRSPTHPAGLDVGTEDLLATVLETVAQPIYFLDAEDVIRFANPAAIAALGYDRADELLGRHGHETIHYRHPDGTAYPAGECPLVLGLETGETVRTELDWFCRRDGSMFPVSYVAAPVAMGQGRGAVVAFADIEDRRRAEQVLREQDAVLIEQQGSLRRVAAIAAQGTPSADVFATIAREAARLLRITGVHIWRYERDGTGTVMGTWSEQSDPFQPGTNWPFETSSVGAYVERIKAGHAVRLDNSADVAGAVADGVRASGIRSAIGVPIVVGGEVWGMITGGAVHPGPLPDDIEDRLAAFTELVATAIADAESRAGLARLAEEQAALRRVATVVARRASSTAVFTAIAEEVGRLLGAEHIRIVRFEHDRDALVMATWGETDDVTQVGARIPLGGDNATSRAFRTRKPARIDNYRTASGAIAQSTLPMGLTGVVAMPVLVARRLWGVIAAATTQDEPLPADTESRMGQFAELMAIAIANTEAHARADQLAEEQAALRRVATLVARESPPAELFAQVVEELANVFGETECLLFRDEGDGTASVVASKGKAMSSAFPVDTRLPTDGDSVTATVLREGRPHRVEAYSTAMGTIAKRAGEHGARSGVGCPVRVHGRIWGAIGALRYGTEPFPPETERRITQFADLVAMAIANAEARDQLRASRERLLTEGDEARRRLVRDLHDGAQQRQVHTIVTLKLAQQALRADDPNAESLVAEALDHAQQGTEELRELAHGILPTALTGGGVRAAVDTLVARLDLPVEVDAAVERLPPAIEATAYFIVAEALTNVVKHARATQATVTARIQERCLHVEVRDDGVGGARLDGSGLLGLADRLAVLDGRLRVESPAGGGTLVAADIPVPG